MSPVAGGVEENRVTRCRSCPPDGGESEERGSRCWIKPGNCGWWVWNEEPWNRWTKRGRNGSYSETEIERRERWVQEEGWIALERKRGGWTAMPLEEGERRIERGAGTRILPEHRAIPGAALNESAFLCLAMLSKRKQHPIIYHPLSKQPPSTLETRPLLCAAKAVHGSRTRWKQSPAKDCYVCTTCNNEVW